MWTTGLELAHDLRMPLQLISSSARMLKQALDDPSLDGGAYADILMASVDQLRGMLEDALSRPRLKNVDLAECVRGLCRCCRPYAEQKGVALRFACNAEPVMLALDEELLSRILLNLISNALRFTPERGEIWVRLVSLGDFAEIRVADTGSGLSPEGQARAFDWGESDGGHGYGLPRARACARALGGELTLRSGEGKGCTFTLRLPIKGISTQTS